jgi:hypothetical protein
MRREAWFMGGAIALAALGFAIFTASRFFDHLDALGKAVARAPAALPPERTDLPLPVAELARRMGARAETSTVSLRQTGEMWSAPGARPMRFSARQISATDQLAYIWTADLGPGGLVKAADYYVDGVGGLEVKAAGLLTLAREVGTPQMAQGEALRYLAELPWNPDAILLNHTLEWTVVDTTHLHVAYGDAVVTFVLGADGLPESMSTPGRVYMDKTGDRLVPWRGRFGRYEMMGGRRVPTEGEVAWLLDGKEFVYWRGRLTGWSAPPARAE